LVQGNKRIQYQQGHNDAVNNGPRDQVDGSGSFDQGPQAQLVIGGMVAHIEYPLLAISAPTAQAATVIDALS
jgi:hypothetical protein